jgi:molecular chaperone GrpE
LNDKKKDVEKEPKREGPARAGAEANKAAADVTAEAEANGGADQAGGAPAGERGAEKEISEADVLKIYLEQSISEIKRLKGELEGQKKAAEEYSSQAVQYKERLSSVLAEYENFRRRTEKEKEELLSEAVVKSVGALLPALDSLERAIQFSESDPERLKQGVGMTLRQLCDGFKSLGVTEIEAQGATFNPDLHNAVMHAEDDSAGCSIVTEVFQKGYAIGDRVIRHSVVKVVN